MEPRRAKGGAMTPAARVAILGAESSGKSTLAAALAIRYDTVWVPEYLREFVETQGRVPFEHDQFGIARLQLEHEAAAVKFARGFLFCDTTPFMTAVYSQVYWGRVDPQLAALDAAHDYALTLVTAPDGPWIPDGLQRESAAVRLAVHQAVIDKLEQRAIPYTLVSGSLEQRVAEAGQALARLLP
jgi:NadR type nicotinamide-nucleotide adenylyltransferase